MQVVALVPHYFPCREFERGGIYEAIIAIYSRSMVGIHIQSVMSFFLKT